MPDATSTTPAALPASIELAPRAIERDLDGLKLIPPGTRVYIVDVGDVPALIWARTCEQLAQARLEPVPHIACRRIRTLEEIEERIAVMIRAGEVRDVLVIGGDINRPVGPFASSMDLLETGVLERNGIRRIGFAGHPEGSPDIPAAEVVYALHRKIEYGRKHGARIRLVTQFGFDPDSAIGFADRLAAEGIEVPIHIGLPGPTSMTTLLKYAALCGVRTSMSFALKRSSAVASLLGGYVPEPYAHAIEQRVRSGKPSLIRQLHVYPFGGWTKAAKWLIERGSWLERSAIGVTKTSSSAGSTP